MKKKKWLKDNKVFKKKVKNPKEEKSDSEEEDSEKEKEDSDSEKSDSDKSGSDSEEEEKSKFIKIDKKLSSKNCFKVEKNKITHIGNKSWEGNFIATKKRKF